MVDRKTKLRWRRLLRKRRRQVEDISLSAEQGLEAHFFKRLGRLVRVWRFTAGWILLLVLVAIGTVLQIKAQSPYYQTLRPAAGGTYTEGIIGAFTTANPLYATSAVDSSVSRLIFSGLLKYDQDGSLAPDLAEKIETDDSGKVHTVTLKQGVTWHDGSPLTANDVLFTYQIIKNPDARSPYFNTWKDIKVSAKGHRTVIFELPNALSTFEESLTNGIVPRHLLRSVSPSELRTHKFNTTNPIGSGPFKWHDLEVSGVTQEARQEVIGLVPNRDFYRDPPKISSFVIRTFRGEDQMIQAYKEGELTSMVGLANVPDDVREVPDFNEYSVPLMGSVMVFFKTTTPPLDEVRVRRALVQSVSGARAVAGLGYHVQLVQGPLLDSHIGFNRRLTQLPTDVARAKKYLDEAGWKMGQDGIRRKAGKELTFALYAQNTSDYSSVAGYLQKVWKELGIKVEVTLLADADMQGIVSRHDYDALLHGISIGNDPDVFAYWHSSQASASSPSRLNFSEYKSKKADEALEAGRTRLDPKVRGAKYEPFLEAWREDAPALALYQPNFLFVTRGKLHNFDAQVLSSTTNRYANVENWMIRQERVIK